MRKLEMKRGQPLGDPPWFGAEKNPELILNAIDMIDVELACPALAAEALQIEFSKDPSGAYYVLDLEAICRHNCETALRYLSMDLGYEVRCQPSPPPPPNFDSPPFKLGGRTPKERKSPRIVRYYSWPKPYNRQYAMKREYWFDETDIPQIFRACPGLRENLRAIGALFADVGRYQKTRVYVINFEKACAIGCIPLIQYMEDKHQQNAPCWPDESEEDYQKIINTTEEPEYIDPKIGNRPKKKSAELVFKKSQKDDWLVSGYAAVFNHPDMNGDIIVPGAFAKSLAVRNPRFLYQHIVEEPIGAIVRIFEDEYGLRFIAKIDPETIRGPHTRAIVRNGEIDGVSIGFETIDAYHDGVNRIITEIDLWEVSIVTFPMQDLAAIDHKERSDADKIDEPVRRFPEEPITHWQIPASVLRAEGCGNLVPRRASPDKLINVSLEDLISTGCANLAMRIQALEFQHWV